MPDQATLIRRYRLDETTGTAAADSSGSGADGTYAPSTGGVWDHGTLAAIDSPRVGRHEAAARFATDQSEQGVTAPGLTLADDERFTITFWRKAHTQPSFPNSNILLHVVDPGDTQRALYIRQRFQHLGVIGTVDGGTNNVLSVSTNIYDTHGIDLRAPGSWHHFAVRVRFGPGGGAKWYWNGQPHGGDYGGEPATLTTPGLFIGEEHFAYFADVRLYRGYLSDQEVLDLYHDDRRHPYLTAPLTEDLLALQ